MDSPSSTQSFVRSTCGPKKSPTRKSCHNCQHFTHLPINLWEGKKCSYITKKRIDEDDFDFEDIDTTDDYEYFDGYEHDQEVQEQKVKIKKKWNGNMASFNEFYDPEIDDLYLPRSYRRKWIPFGSTHKIAKNVWKSA